MLTEMKPHFMLIPSLACQASCKYCFGPHHGAIMTEDMLDKVLDFMKSILAETGQRHLHITFHGGEPLLAGHGYWRYALENIRNRFARLHPTISLQSNLWLLDDRFCKMFKEYNVEIGTSLDGPEDINDSQRGKDYFLKTRDGVARAAKHGLSVNYIATFTSVSAREWQRIFHFFRENSLHFSIHASVSSLAGGQSGFVLSPQEYSDLLLKMIGEYIRYRHQIRIASLDQMYQSVALGKGQVCLLQNCIGKFIAIDPHGDIYPCQRFCGLSDYRLGNVNDTPALEELLSSPVANAMKQRHDEVQETCSQCEHWQYCQGGCYYNYLAGENRDEGRDPYCPAYRKTFDFIKQRLIEEMQSEENIAAVSSHPYQEDGHPLLKKGPHIELTKKEAHPTSILKNALAVIGAYHVAKEPDIRSAADSIVKQGILDNRENAESYLVHLKEKIDHSHEVLNNLYLYITTHCQLACSHCYLYDPDHPVKRQELPVKYIVPVIQESYKLGFRQVVVLGGEPLLHSNIKTICDEIRKVRNKILGMNLVLRTNLALSSSHEQLFDIATAFDQVVVSVDGNEASHDARRGKGVYQKVVQNLTAYQERFKHNPEAAELSLACVMSTSDIHGEPGDSVRKLGERLGIRRLRFRPILPLGRARAWETPPLPEALNNHVPPEAFIEHGFQPVKNCGIGQNVYIDPSGDAFPCYAYMKPHALIGNVLQTNLSMVILSKAFQKLSQHTVDTNRKCRTCDVRYLCGGACRAWGGEQTQYDLDASPPDCKLLYARAHSIYLAACGVVVRYLPTVHRTNEYLD